MDLSPFHEPNTLSRVEDSVRSLAAGRDRSRSSIGETVADLDICAPFRGFPSRFPLGVNSSPTIICCVPVVLLDDPTTGLKGWVLEKTQIPAAIVLFYLVPISIRFSRPIAPDTGGPPQQPQKVQQQQAQHKPPRDYQVKGKTKQFFNVMFNSEGEARNFARQKIGSNSTEVEPYKWRSSDGKWQYRAKPGDLEDGHIHLEQLDPKTGEVLQNFHLTWPAGKGRQ